MYCIVSQIAFDIPTKLPAVVASVFSFGIGINSLTLRQRIQVEEYKPRRYIFLKQYLTVVHK